MTFQLIIKNETGYTTENYEYTPSDNEMAKAIINVISNHYKLSFNDALDVYHISPQYFQDKFSDEVYKILQSSCYDVVYKKYLLENE